MSYDSTFKQMLKSLFELYAENPSIEVISLATTDGFPVCTVNKNNSEFEEDSLAAAASTLHSVSNAVTQQILGKRFKITFIEAQQGNVAFVSLECKNRDFVLVMSAQQTLNIASLRLLISRLAKEISDLDISTAATSF